MALMKKNETHEFVVQPDPKTPAVISWRDATPKEWAEFQSARANLLVRAGAALTPRQSLEMATIVWQFVESLIVSVKGWEVEEAGATHELAWPADKDAILDLFEPGLLQLYKDSVLNAHSPNSVEQHARACGKEVFPNS